MKWAYIQIKGKACAIMNYNDKVEITRRLIHNEITPSFTKIKEQKGDITSVQINQDRNYLYPIHTEIFAPKSNEINFIPVRDCWLLVGRFLSLVKNIVRPITGHGRLFVTSEENRRALSVFSQRLASNGELFFISRQIKWHQDLRI